LALHTGSMGGGNPPAKTIYGDGQNTVAVDAVSVVLTNREGEVIVLSHAAFREVVLGWERHKAQEEETDE